MELDINRPMVRWFFFCSRIFHNARPSTIEKYRTNGVGYCKFWRVCLIWPPLFIVGCLACLIFFGSLFYDAGLVFLLSVGVLALFLAVLFGIVLGVLYLKEWYEKKVNGEVSTLTLVFSYIKAVKKRLCPIIQFKNSEKS